MKEKSCASQKATITKQAGTLPRIFTVPYKVLLGTLMGRALC